MEINMLRQLQDRRNISDIKSAECSYSGSRLEPQDSHVHGIYMHSHA